MSDYKDSIERCPHDAEHPYAQILNEILRHKTLSVEAIWLLSYLLSHSRTWKIKIPQIVKHVKGRIGRDRVYSVINELIEFGYMQRVPIKKGNLHQGFKYFVSEKAKFKKCFRHPDFQDTEIQHAENPHTKEQLCSKKTISKEQQQRKAAEASVVVASDKDEKEELADQAATQYIESQKKKGIQVNESAIRRTALKGNWKPQEERDPKKLAERFQSGVFYRGKNNLEFECFKNKNCIEFVYPKGTHVYSISWNSPMFFKEFNDLLNKLGIESKENYGTE